MKVNVNISVFVSLLASPMREDELKARDTAGSEIGSPSPSMPDFTLSWLLSSKRRNVSLIRISWRVPSVVSWFEPPFCHAGFLNVCASVASWMLRIVASAAFLFTTRRIHLDRFVRRLCSTALRYDALRPSYLVIKLSLREASE